MTPSSWQRPGPSWHRSGASQPVPVDVTELATVEAAVAATARGPRRHRHPGLQRRHRRALGAAVGLSRRRVAARARHRPHRRLLLPACRRARHDARQNYGRICSTASIAGKEGNPNASAYSAAKAGVIALTKSLGKELAGLDIAVNCITPAAARTRIFEQISQQHIDYMLAKIPRGRFVEVDEVAAMVAWLVSSENSFTTGAVFDLSGGRATY